MKGLLIIITISKVVPPVRLELTHPKIMDFESIASTNSTTGAAIFAGADYVPTGAKIQVIHENNLLFQPTVIMS